MAAKPIDTPLPADLPENWTAGQIISPDGIEAGLTKQHGYNYLMAMVNRAQQCINAVNQAFETVSGKRTCRVVVGTSASGWTAADCDFLCDGTDDQEEINLAIAEIPSSGGEIVILDGTYHLSGPLKQLNKVYFHGNGVSTILVRETENVPLKPPADSVKYYQWMIGATNSILADFTFDGNRTIFTNMPEKWNVCEIAAIASTVRNVQFRECVGGALELSKYTLEGMSQAVDCFFLHCEVGIYLGDYGQSYVSNNQFKRCSELIHAEYNHEILENQQTIHNCIISRNAAEDLGDIVLDGTMECVVIANHCHKIQIKNTSGLDWLGAGNVIAANSLRPTQEHDNCIILDANTKSNFVTANSLMGAYSVQNNEQGHILDQGTGNIIRFNSNDSDSGSSGSGSGGGSAISYTAGEGIIIEGNKISVELPLKETTLAALNNMTEEERNRAVYLIKDAQAEDSGFVSRDYVDEQVNGLKDFVSDGKTRIASAITDQGISTSPTADFPTMEANIRKISSGSSDVETVSMDVVNNGDCVFELITAMMYTEYEPYTYPTCKYTSVDPGQTVTIKVPLKQSNKAFLICHASRASLEADAPDRKAALTYSSSGDISFSRFGSNGPVDSITGVAYFSLFASGDCKIYINFTQGKGS